MALTIEQIQAQLVRSFEEIHALSQELGTVNGKVDYLNTDRLAKDQQFEELKSANRQLVDAIQRSTGGTSSVSRPSDIGLFVVLQAHGLHALLGWTCFADFVLACVEVT